MPQIRESIDALAKDFFSLRWLRHALYIAFIPEYIGVPWKYKNARVQEKVLVQIGFFKFYYLKVIFDEYKDCQSIYPPNYKRRKGVVAVSKRLYEASPNHIGIFCQYSRHYDDTEDVKVMIAK